MPAGDAATARQIGDRTRDAGIAAVSYGSYQRADQPRPCAAFAPLVDTALGLGAGNIRLWARDAEREAAGEVAIARVAGDLREMADAAAAQGVTLSLEFHRRTPTERAEDALTRLARADRPNLFTYWQPPPSAARTSACGTLPPCALTSPACTLSIARPRPAGTTDAPSRRDATNVRRCSPPGGPRRAGPPRRTSIGLRLAQFRRALPHRHAGDDVALPKGSPA